MFLGYSACVYKNLWLNVQVLVDQLQRAAIIMRLAGHIVQDVVVS